jgi:hypothetical protein
MAVGFSSMILWWVRILNEFEVSGTCSPHRIVDAGPNNHGTQAIGKYTQTI